MTMERTADGTARQPTRRLRLAAVAAVLGVIALALCWSYTGKNRTADSSQISSIAFNLLLLGEFHDGWNRWTREFYMRREPILPLFFAAAFATVPEYRSLARACVGEKMAPLPQGAGHYFYCHRNDYNALAPLHERVGQATAVLSAMTVAGTFLAVFFSTKMWGLSVAAGLLCTMLLRLDAGSTLAAFFLLGHTLLAVRAWRRPSLAAGAASGLALGLLVLTKAIFQYWLWGVALLWLAGLWRDAGRRRTLAPVCAAMLVLAGALTLPWMIRNYMGAGYFGISGRGGEILALRAEHGRGTWPEVRGAFAYWLPVNYFGVRDIALRVLKPATHGYARFDGRNPVSFYASVKRPDRARLQYGFRAEVMARADRIDPCWPDKGNEREAIFRQAAMELIWEDWPKHAVLTAAFAVRGSAFHLLGSHPVANRYGEAAGNAVRDIRDVAKAVSLLFLPALGFMLVVVWRHRDFAVAFLLLPLAYGFGIHAVATHFIPRYSEPLVPAFVVVLALAAREVWRWASELLGQRIGQRRGSSAVRYVASGLCGWAVGVGVTALAHDVLKLSVQVSFGLTLVVLFAFHFVANAYFVFRSGAGRDRLLRYAVVALSFRGLDYLLFAGLTALTSLHYLIAVIGALSVSNAIKFIIYSRHVFGDSRETLL